MERRRLITRVVIVGVAIVLAVFAYSALKSGAAADECARQLVDAVARHDSAYIETAVRNPSMRATLRNAEHVELAFVRPMSTEWTRVGLFVSTGTKAEAVHLSLPAKDMGSCTFLRDYDDGAFSE